MPTWAWFATVAGLLVAVYVVWTFNRLVGLSRRADAAWSDIDVQLKRRWDLVPALVATVEGYARHEREALEQTVAARTAATQAASVAGRGSSEEGLSRAVGRLFAVAEAYPDLKASQSFLDLHKNLVEIENNVQYARRYYNAVVRDLNTLVASIPPALVAGPAGFRERDYFQLEDDAQRAAPKVSLTP